MTRAEQLLSAVQQSGFPHLVRLGLIRMSSGHVPVPSNMSVCGLPLSVSVTVSVPVLEPFAEGVKVTVIVQVPPFPATEVHPLLCTLKSPLFAPVIVTAETVTVVVP
jgi:type III secretory pathway component EscR